MQQVFMLQDLCTVL